MTELQDYFEKNKSNCIHKWMHYFDIYDFWFKKYKDKPIVILEIGVYQGGSLKMWKNYFGKKAKIYAIDINPLCKQFESDNTKIFIGSQEDEDFLREVKSQIPKIDILIDDGGHTMKQQITSFKALYEHINDEGIYLCEDLHTSYWPDYGGGYKNKKTFIEYSKSLVDYLNAWYSDDPRLKVNEFTKTAFALHYYDSILVIEKKIKKQPEVKMSGEIIIPIDNFSTPPKVKRGLLKRIKLKIYRLKIKYEKKN